MLVDLIWILDVVSTLSYGERDWQRNINVAFFVGKVTLIQFALLIFSQRWFNVSKVIPNVGSTFEHFNLNYQEKEVNFPRVIQFKVDKILQVWLYFFAFYNISQPNFAV